MKRYTYTGVQEIGPIFDADGSDVFYVLATDHEREVERLRAALLNISTVYPLERFPAVTALAYCREKALEALNGERSAAASDGGEK